MDIDHGFSGTNPAEWHDEPRYYASAHKIIGTKTLNHFAEHVVVQEDYMLDPRKKGDESQNTSFPDAKIAILFACFVCKNDR